MASRQSTEVVVEFEVTRILEGASDLEEAAPDLLRTICEGFGWDVGEIWLLDADSGMLSLFADWHASSLDVGSMEEMARGIAAGRGYGIPGRVLQRGAPVWVEDIRADPGFARKEAAARAGLLCAYCFPMVGGGIINGAVELLARKVPDVADISETLASIGRTIGEFALSEQAVQRSAPYYRAIVENQCDIVALIGIDGAIHYENSAVTTVLGYDRRERIGKIVYDFVHPEDLAIALETFRAAIDNPGNPHYLKVRARHKNGSWRVLESVGRIMVDNSGTHVALVNSRDVTEREAKERVSSRARSLPGSGKPLTPREIRVLQLVSEGKSNRTIADELSVSHHTIKDNVKAAMRKLQAHTRAQAVLAATRLGLL